MIKEHFPSALDARKAMAIGTAFVAGVGGLVTAGFATRASASGNSLKEIPRVVPNDPGYVGSSAIALQQINFEQLLALKSPRRIGCANIDTGVNPNPDLNVISNYNGADGSASAPDTNGHGTATASVMAAKANNNYGIAGIAGDICDVINIKANGSLAAEIHHAADDPNVEVINADVEYANGQTPVQTVNDELRYAISKNKVVCVPAGNYSANLDTNPNANAFASSAPPDVIVVGGVDNRGSSVISNTGSRVDVVAPLILTVDTLNGGFKYDSGTSFSSPVVCGLAAWIKAQNPNMSPHDVKQIIVSTEQPNKLVDLYKAAITAHVPAAPPVTTSTNTTTTTPEKKYTLNAKITTGANLGRLTINGKKMNSPIYQTTIKGQVETIRPVKKTPKAYVKSVIGCENTQMKKTISPLLACYVKLDGIHAGKPVNVENVRYAFASH